MKLHMNYIFDFVSKNALYDVKKYGFEYEKLL